MVPVYTFSVPVSILKVQVPRRRFHRGIINVLEGEHGHRLPVFLCREVFVRIYRR